MDVRSVRVERYPQFIKLCCNCKLAYMQLVGLLDDNYRNLAFDRDGSIVPGDRFFIDCTEDNTINIAVGAYKGVMETLKHSTLVLEGETEYELPDAVDVTFYNNGVFTPWDTQKVAIEKVVDEGINNALVESQPGKGKTLVAVFSAEALGRRVGVMVKPKYLDKWVDDPHKYLSLERKEVMVVTGSDSLKKLMVLALEDAVTASIIIFSNATHKQYIEMYYKDRVAYNLRGYKIPPEDLFMMLGIGTLIIDEVHEEMAYNSRLLASSNVGKIIALSGTFFDPNPQVAKLLEMMFPLSNRVQADAADPYIDIRAVKYTLSNLNNIRWTLRGSNNYSHIAYEQSLKRQPARYKAYFTMIAQIVEAGYTRRKRPNDKGLILVGAVETATDLVKFLQKEYPKLDIRKYTGEDDYTDLLEADISVSTVLSAGTGVDISSLIFALMTTNLRSPRTNIQAVHRVRKLKDMDVLFYYLFASNMRKHMAVHKEKELLLRPYAKSFKIMSYNRTI